MDNREARSASSALADDADDDDDRDLEGDVRLDDAKRAGANRRLRQLQDNCLAEKPRIPGPFAEVFEIATELVY